MEHSEKVIGYLTEAGYHSSKFNKEKDTDDAKIVPHPPSYVGTPLYSAVLLGDKQQVQRVIKEQRSSKAGFGRCGKSIVSVAVVGRDEDLLELLLKNGCSPVAPGADDRTPLHHAAQKALDGCMRLLLGWCEAHGTSPAEAALIPDKHGVAPLHVATTTSSTKCLGLLLKHLEAGMQDPQDEKKRTPLHWAARYNNEPAVALLLRHGANCHMPDDHGQTPLHCALLPPLPQSVVASRSGNVEGRHNGMRESSDGGGVTSDAVEAAQLGCTSKLVEESPNIVTWPDSNGLTALHVAACSDNVQCVQLLLKHKSGRACSNVLDNSFRTPLHWAAISNKSSVMRALLAAGADINNVDCHDGTALHYAAYLRHCDCVRVLSQQPEMTEQLQGAVEWAAAARADECIRVMVEHGAQLVASNDENELYCPALVRAAQCGHVGTVALLLSVCNIVDGADSTGVTALHAAALGGYPHCAKYLLGHGATMAKRDRRGRHVLHYATLGGHSQFAALVIKAGTDVNVQDTYGLACLHEAAMRGYLGLVNLLIENGADVNVNDFQGASPLHYAAQTGDVAVVSALLEAGAMHSDLAHFNMEDGSVYSVTPLDLAIEEKHCAVVELLQAVGAVTVKDLRETASCVIQDAWRRYKRLKKINSVQKFAKQDCRLATSLIISEGATHEKSASVAGKFSVNPTICRVRPVSLKAHTVNAAIDCAKSARMRNEKDSSHTEHSAPRQGSNLKRSGVVRRQLSEEEHKRKIEEFRQWKKGLRVKEVRRLPDESFSYNLSKPPLAPSTTFISNCTSNASRKSANIPDHQNKNCSSSKSEPN